MTAIIFIIHVAECQGRIATAAVGAKILSG